MVRSKLSRIYKKYLGIPYWRNQVSEDGTILSEGPFGGKGNIRELRYATACARAEEKNSKPISDLEIQEKYHIGLECSGLIYNILDEIAQSLGLPGVYYKLAGEWRGVKRYGARAVSALHLAQPQNATKVDLPGAKAGDLIIMMGKDNIGHVMLIVDKQADYLSILHTSSQSHLPYVHVFKILIENWQKDLFLQQDWQETTSHGQDFREIFDLKNNLTGIYRPNFLSLLDLEL